MIKLFQVFYKMAICISCLDIEMQKLLHPYPDRSALEILSDTAYMSASAQIPAPILPWYFVKSTPRPARTKLEISLHCQVPALSSASQKM